MQKQIVKIFFCLILFSSVSFLLQDARAANEKVDKAKAAEELKTENATLDKEATEKETKTDSSLKLKLDLKDTVCRSRSPIMIDIIFENISVNPQKVCTYKFYDSLIKLDIRNSKGEKIEFAPKLVQADKLTANDWVTVAPGRSFKRSFSLSQKIMDSTGRRLAPGHYSIKIVYEGCSKFDPDLPEVMLESSWFYLMVTD